MTIVIGPGITIGNGVTVTSVPTATLRSVLSPTGQTAYDAATVGNWFSVSASDYGNVFAQLSGTSKVGMSDVQVSTANNGFSQNFGTTLDIANATVAAGSYIIGFVSRTASSGSGTSTFNTYTSGTFRGSYTQLGQQLSMTANNTFYWIRKNPTVQDATTYVCTGPLAGTIGWQAFTATWGSGATGGAYSSSPTGGSWTSYNSVLPVQQWLLTTTAQW